MVTLYCDYRPLDNPTHDDWCNTHNYEPGTIKLSPKVEKLLHDAGNAVVLRHVSFYAYTLEEFCVLDLVHLCKRDFHVDEQWVYTFIDRFSDLSVIGLNYGRDSGLKERVIDGFHLFARRARLAGLPFTAVVKGKAREIAGREGFKGFTLDNVK